MANLVGHMARKTPKGDGYLYLLEKMRDLGYYENHAILIISGGFSRCLDE